MLSIVLKHLERLQDELAAIDPAHDVDAADKVAAIASALRDAGRAAETSDPRVVGSAGRQAAA